MVTSLLAATLALSAKIDFETTGATVPAIVERLAEQTGLPLIADKSLECDVLVLSLKQVEVDQALDWIASVIDGEWRDDRGKRRLLRTPATEIAQAKKERADAMRAMRRALDSIKLAPPIDKEAAERMVQLIKPTLGNVGVVPLLPYEIASRSPMQRLVTRLAKDLDYSKFDDIPDNVSVYVPFDEQSADPRLPRSLTKYLQDFRKEDAVYSSVITQSGLDLDQMNGFLFLPGAWSDGPLKGAVTLTKNEGMYDVSVVMRWGLSFSRFESLKWPEGAWYDEWRAIQRPEWAVEWKVPKRTKEFAALTSPLRTPFDSAQVEVPEPLIDYFTVSEDFDVMGLGAGQVLIDAAELSGRNLVACLPDQAALQIRSVNHQPKPTVQWMLDSIAATFWVDATVTDALLMFKPKMPTAFRAQRVPRGTIRQIVMDSLVGKSDLMVCARACAAMEPAGWNIDPREEYSTVSRIRHFRTNQPHHSAFVLRLYGNLSAAQRDDAGRDGLLVPWASLPKSERNNWGYILMNAGFVGYPGEWTVDLQPGSRETIDRINALRAAARSPQGPDGLVVRVTKSESLIGGSTTVDYAVSQMVDGRSLASMVAHKELGLSGWDYDRFVVLPYTKISVSVRVGGKDVPIAEYGESYAKEGRGLFGYESIPKELIESQRAEIDAIKKLLKDRGGR